MAYCLRDSFARPLNQHTYPVGSSENVSVRCWKDPMTVRCGRSRHRTLPQALPWAFRTLRLLLDLLLPDTNSH